MGTPGHGALPVLITTAIRPAQGVHKLAVVDPSTRLQATLDAVGHWRRIAPAHPLVVCDGSGIDLERAGFAHPMTELLSFQNDVASVSRQGKGYGEGEIIAHALEHSKVLRGASHFVKCTGKLWVEDFQQHVSGATRAIRIPAMFQVHTWVFSGMDTRFYVVDSSFYRQHLLDAHREVDDRAGRALEQVFVNRLRAAGLRCPLMLRCPDIRGLSGSEGTTAAHQSVRQRLAYTVRALNSQGRFLLAGLPAF